jgi:hypothetical protein|tara:strand:+ start:127 stop:384 length:258 start_codon:yes stop_codon:yes gene_type:complete
MIEQEMFYIVWVACGICMYLSHLMGKSEGYKNAQIEIATTIVDIQLEKIRVQALKQEVESHQQALLEIQKETEQLIKDSKPTEIA